MILKQQISEYKDYIIVIDDKLISLTTSNSDLNDELQKLRKSNENLKRRVDRFRQATESRLYPLHNGLNVDVVMRVQDPSDHSVVWCLVK